MDNEVTPTPEHVIDKHVCGTCHDEFLSEDEYLDHVCPVTGFTPRDPDHHGPEFANVQKAALERGMETLVASDAPQEHVERQQAAIDGVTPVADQPPTPEVQQ
jgi:hypothetical protein